jgi:Zn-dependent protease with chaperone function
MPIGLDLSKAKDIHRDNIRAARLPLLQAKDLEFQRAQETSADTAAIVTAKQALRDAPAAAAIDAASTADELKEAWDINLLGDSPYA